MAYAIYRCKKHVIHIILSEPQQFMRGVLWLSGRVSDSGARGRGFETYRRRVVSLSKTLYSPKVPRKRWLRPNMTEKMLTGTLSLNTNKQTVYDKIALNHVIF